MDLPRPGGGGVEAITELTRRGLPCKVLVLTTYGTESDTIAAIEAGATGYLLKDAPRPAATTSRRGGLLPRGGGRDGGRLPARTFRIAEAGAYVRRT